MRSFLFLILLITFIVVYSGPPDVSSGKSSSTNVKELDSDIAVLEQIQAVIDDSDFDDSAYYGDEDYELNWIDSHGAHINGIIYNRLETFGNDAFIEPIYAHLLYGAINIFGFDVDNELLLDFSHNVRLYRYAADVLVHGPSGIGDFVNNDDSIDEDTRIQTREWSVALRQTKKGLSLLNSILGYNQHKMGNDDGYLFNQNKNTLKGYKRWTSNKNQNKKFLFDSRGCTYYDDDDINDAFDSSEYTCVDKSLSLKVLSSSNTNMVNNDIVTDSVFSTHNSQFNALNFMRNVLIDTDNDIELQNTALELAFRERSVDFCLLQQRLDHGSLSVEEQKLYNQLKLEIDTLRPYLLRSRQEWEAQHAEDDDQ